MKTQEWKTIDKSEWPRGPWDSEPDKKQWQDAETGLPCLLHRGPGGHWCGYVGVPLSHPWHGIEYNHCPLPEAKPQGVKDGHDYTSERVKESLANRLVCNERGWCGHTPESRIAVHGGLTFSSACADTDDESTGICHLPDEGEEKHVWWFGFDCAHLGDLSPKHQCYRGVSWERDDETYKDTTFVEGQCARLAKQLADIKPDPSS